MDTVRVLDDSGVSSNVILTIHVVLNGAQRSEESNTAFAVRGDEIPRYSRNEVSSVGTTNTLRMTTYETKNAIRRSVR